MEQEQSGALADDPYVPPNLARLDEPDGAFGRPGVRGHEAFGIERTSFEMLAASACGRGR